PAPVGDRGDVRSPRRGRGRPPRRLHLAALERARHDARGAGNRARLSGRGLLLAAGSGIWPGSGATSLSWTATARVAGARARAIPDKARCLVSAVAAAFDGCA